MGLTQVGQTALAWEQGHSTHMDVASVQVLPTPSTSGWEYRPQAPTGEPGPAISLCQGSCNSPCL